MDRRATVSIESNWLKIASDVIERTPHTGFSGRQTARPHSRCGASTSSYLCLRIFGFLSLSFSPFAVKAVDAGRESLLGGTARTCWQTTAQVS